MVSNSTIPRTHSLCPNTRYEIGYLDYSNNLYNGQDMIPLRSNMHLRCGGGGGHGSSQGQGQDCIIFGGDIQVDGSNMMDTSIDAVENVLFEGLTFANASMHNVWINKPGSITFKNCTFRDNALALTPVLADYHDSSYDDHNNDNNGGDDTSAPELSITFSNCLFENNRFAGPPAQPAIVVANGMRNRLVFHDCNFVGNDMLEGNAMV
jgi:Right handed beta helix region